MSDDLKKIVMGDEEYHVASATRRVSGPDTRRYDEMSTLLGLTF